MELFTIDRATYTQGEIVNGVDTCLWVERYNTPGEFTITTKPENGLREILAPDTLISHTDSTQIMMVESHDIREVKDKGAVLEITGRALETIMMENRAAIYPNYYILGDFGFLATNMTYAPTWTFPTIDAWDCIHQLLYFSMQTPTATSMAVEAYPLLHTANDIVRPDPDAKERAIKTSSTIAKAVYELLDASNMGLKLLRPSAGDAYLQLHIHEGYDRSGTNALPEAHTLPYGGIVQFDYEKGDIENGRYFWSNKNFRNSAYVSNGIYMLRSRPASTSGLDLRISAVDATDYTPDMPGETTAQLNSLAAVLASRARDDIGQHKRQTILEATVSKSARYIYNIHYGMGDVVYVNGNYGVSQAMRVTEYARTMDASGESGFPTLSPL